MRNTRNRDQDDGLISLDFIIGFTIFMVALIFIGIMVSGLLVHLEGRTIDYDAVAYRTSVVLVEDPGEPKTWQLLDIRLPAKRDEVLRLGLAIEKNYPGILSLSKVEKFFSSSSAAGCSVTGSFCNPDDYRKKLIFGDYPYNFNISLRGLDSPSLIYSVGMPIPENSHYGFMKRIVKIQIPASVQTYNVTSDTESVYNITTFRFEMAELYAIPASYWIDPLNEASYILIQNFTSPTNITEAKICAYSLDGVKSCIDEPYDDSPRMNITIDGNEPYNPGNPGTEINSNLTLILEAGYLARIGYDSFGSIDVILTFDQNVTNQNVIYYTYDSLLTFPHLEPAVMEVRIW